MKYPWSSPLPTVPRFSLKQGLHLNRIVMDHIDHITILWWLPAGRRWSTRKKGSFTTTSGWSHTWRGWARSLPAWLKPKRGVAWFWRLQAESMVRLCQTVFLSQLVTACAKPWKVEICRDLQSAFAMDSMRPLTIGLKATIWRPIMLCPKKLRCTNRYKLFVNSSSRPKV